eukprot:Phypoly_transcript_13806.p1 GENE.Phypoly_transcript_13806~~Phypoly_transcript_13806.p1  ORF type:complete len:195 (-),score=15.17 Phypoly_transcript_13806:326-910(-)
MGSVDLLVGLLQILRVQSVLDETGIVGLVGFGVFLLELAHVVGNMSSEDVAAEGLSLELLALSVVSNKTVHRVGDVKSSVCGSLQGSEDLATSAGLPQTHIQEAFEGADITIDGGDQVVLTVDVFVSLVFGVELEFLQHSAGDQQTGSVGSGVVGVSYRDTELGEFVAISSCQHKVSLDLGVNDLADGILVCLF